MDDIVNNEEVCVLVCVCVRAFFLEIKYLLDCFFFFLPPASVERLCLSVCFPRLFARPPA